mgnify:CR=1 FL=1
MEFLPNTCIECTNTDFIKHIGDGRVELINFIEEHIEADCWALVVDDEIMFNSYNHKRTLKEIILDDTMRQHISSDVENDLLYNLGRTNGTQSRNYIDIYMFGNQSWKVRISCKWVPVLDYQISFYKTPETTFDFLIPLSI